MVRPDPLLRVPNVPMPQAFSPRARYQNPALGAGIDVSLTEGAARLSKQLSSPPPGPTGNALVLPRSTSYCAAYVAVDQLKVALSAAAVTL